MKNSKILLAAGAFLLMLTTTLAAQNTGDNEIDAIFDFIQASNYMELEGYLASDGDVNATDAIGNSPLIYAAKIGDKRMIDLLIHHKANVNQSNQSGATPLMIASKYGNEYTVQVLLHNGADPKVQNNSGNTAQSFASAYKQYKVLDMLE